MSVKKISISAAALLLLLPAGCVRTSLRDDDVAGQYQKTGKETIRDMVNTISTINTGLPESYSAEFSIDGVSGVKHFKSLGSAQFNRKERAMYVSFTDFIFKSPVMVLMMDGDLVRIYYPAEKRLFVDNVNTIDMANYSGPGIDFDLLHDLATGTFPLIKNYSVKQGYRAVEGTGTMLIIENAKYYETISFKGKVPDKILLMNKRTREKTEVYVKKVLADRGSRFFGTILLVADQGRLRLELNFSNIKLNAPVRVKTFRDMRLPGDIKIIKM